MAELRKSIVAQLDEALNKRFARAGPGLESCLYASRQGLPKESSNLRVAFAKSHRAAAILN